MGILATTLKNFEDKVKKGVEIGQQACKKLFYQNTSLIAVEVDALRAPKEKSPRFFDGPCSKAKSNVIWRRGKKRARLPFRKAQRWRQFRKGSPCSLDTS